MTFAVSAEQREFAAAVRGLVATQGSLMQAWNSLADTGDYDEKWWRRATTELAMTSLIVPEASGGQGRSLFDLVLALEETGSSLVGGDLALLSGPVATLLKDVAPRSQVLEALVSGRVRVAYGVRIDANETLPVCSESVGDRGISVTGSVRSVVCAATSGYIVVSCRRQNAPTPEADALVLVDTHAAGVTMTATTGIDPGRPTYTVDLDNVEASLLAEGRGLAVSLRRSWDVGATCIAAESAAATQRALDDLLVFTTGRVQFGVPIGSFQAIQHRCADLLVLAQNAITAARYAAWVADSRPEHLSEAASLAKSYANDAFEHAASEHLQLHGGIGFTMEHASHLFLRRATSSAHLFGSSEWHRARLRRLISGRPDRTRFESVASDA